MDKQKPGIIRDNKKRGEWAEAVFAARAAENGLQVSKPSGDSETFDCVVGTAGRFVAVQVKCTIARSPNAKGYICNLKTNNVKYEPGSFDFLAAYAILEDTWYLVPEKEIRGRSALSLCSTMPKYERYREAWNLLREASGEGSPVKPESGLNGPPEFEDAARGPAVARMQGAFSSFRNYLEKGGR